MSEAEYLNERYASCEIDDPDSIFYIEREGPSIKFQKLQTRLKTRYKERKAGSVPVGKEFRCVYCNKPQAKKHPAQLFCSPIKRGNKKIYRCKDRYWNTVEDSRHQSDYGRRKRYN